MTTIFWYATIGWLAVSLVGSVLHFFYDWHHHCRWLAFFVAVNESTWEHLKLAVVPLYVWLAVGLALGVNNLALGGLLAMLTAMIVIPAIFYSYTHFTGRPILAVDISSFFVALAVAMGVAAAVFGAPALPLAVTVVAWVLVAVVALCFILFSYWPPHAWLWRDPLTNKYGLAGHCDDSRYGNCGPCRRLPPA